MPAKSRQQFKFFKALANNPELAKEHGMSTKEADEFTKGNKGKKSYKNLPKKAKKAKKAALKELLKK